MRFARRTNEAGDWGDVRFETARVTRVSDDVAALTYKVVARWKGEDAQMSALCTSVYVRSSNQWKLALHQQSAYPEAS